MYIKRSITLVLVSILILSFLFSSMAVSAEGGGTTTYLPIIWKYGSLNVGYSSAVGLLSPFFSASSDELDIVNLTQLNLLTTDRQAMVVENAIVGETRSFNGTLYTYTGPADTAIDINTATGNTLYTFTLRSDLKFADGMPVSADDLIFTLYTFFDPSYDGSNQIINLPILGLQEYQTQLTSEIYAKYENFYASIYGAGKEHVWDPSDLWTQAQQTDVWNRLEQALANEVTKIIDYVVSNYADAYAWEYIGFTPDQVYSTEGLQVALGMRMWGFADVNTSTKILTANCSGNTWNLNYEYPSQADYADEIMLCYNNDYRAAFPYESADGTDVYEQEKLYFILYWGPLDPEMIGGIPNISGIHKLDQSTVTIEVEGFEPARIYSFGIPVTPLHYYGSAAKYNYALNMFGFDFGDLSLQRSKDYAPMGAGPFQFASRQDSEVLLTANSYHYKGEPKIYRIKFVEIDTYTAPQLLSNGFIDVAEMNYNQSILQEIRTINSNGEITGDVITTSKVDNLGYGYIGINARLVKVGDDPSSTASRNLRKALSTILAVYRKPATEAYYSPDGASTLEYPTILSSWASPQPGDPGYREAFSVDVDGLPIYTPGMSQAQKVSAAREAALGFFEAAGFTVSGGMLVAAPAGAKLNYEVIVPGGGTGDHPAYGLLVAAQETLSEIGMTLNIYDPPDSNVLWDALDNGTQELWTAAWGSDIDPDMYQVYHSSNTFDQPDGTHSNHYYIQDPQLDELIMQARSSDDQALRKELYRQAFDIIMDWGAEIPKYSRKNYEFFSTQRVNTATITPGITTFWGWQNDIENLRMK